ncbi:hypothetical protein ASD80_07720 [Devosia sp. Root635]|nr:hypothetical protein ASD80_07720 [Devosia sp. Root635]
MRHHDAERFSGDFYDNWLMGLSPVETAFLHGWMLHLRIARGQNWERENESHMLAGNAGGLSEN